MQNLWEACSAKRKNRWGSRRAMNLHGCNKCTRETAVVLINHWPISVPFLVCLLWSVWIKCKITWSTTQTFHFTVVKCNLTCFKLSCQYIMIKMCLTSTFDVNLVMLLWQGWRTSDGLVALWRSWLEQPMIAELAGVNCYHIRTGWWFIHSVHKVGTSFFTENLRKRTISVKKKLLVGKQFM